MNANKIWEFIRSRAGFINRKLAEKISFWLIGIVSTAWFLIRVIPKPSRAAYPCLRATAPFMSGFILYLLSLSSSLLLFRRARLFLFSKRYFLFLATAAGGMIFAITTIVSSSEKAVAITNAVLEEANKPIGKGVGIAPGRVVWVHNPDATNENMVDENSGNWSSDASTDQDVVNRMVSDALQALSKTSTDEGAWEAIFRYHNLHQKGADIGYTPGEKIVIKLNMNTAPTDSPTRDDLTTVDTSPHLAYSILDQLINVVGVDQSDISIGDPGRTVDQIYWNKCHPDFPDVHYWGNVAGRTKIVPTEEKVFFSSDGSVREYLPSCYVQADYMINVPVLKKHHRGGISLSSKNHFGTFVPFSGSAFHLHYSLPCPDGKADNSNGEYGSYRIFVDFIGHRDLGAKTILYLLDGLWTTTNWAHPPIKWRMDPFNNDYPSSIFASQDPVAIESVGFDFLREEFDTDHPTEGAYDPTDQTGPFPQYNGVDDFLHQAASSDNWPDGFSYDPEKDGTPLPSSMGVHEHWNNAADRKYARNLGQDEGIELVYISQNPVGMDLPLNPSSKGILILGQNYPNPLSLHTVIPFELNSAARISIMVFNMQGRRVSYRNMGQLQAGEYKIDWYSSDNQGNSLSPGIYHCVLEAMVKQEITRQTIKLTIAR